MQLVNGADRVMARHNQIEAEDRWVSASPNFGPENVTYVSVCLRKKRLTRRLALCLIFSPLPAQADFQ